MKEIEMIQGARTIVETCAGVKSGESVLVVTDTNMVSIAQGNSGNAVFNRE
jgi:hypothetical protein